MESSGAAKVFAHGFCIISSLGVERGADQDKAHIFSLAKQTFSKQDPPIVFSLLLRTCLDRKCCQYDELGRERQTTATLALALPA